MKLVIVESPTKSRTIARFLGKEYTVESSYGHIRDLPSYTLGVDVENNFEPQYVVPRKVQPIIRKLKALSQKADTIILATDEDREGEAIAWHLIHALGLSQGKNKKSTFVQGSDRGKVKNIERIVFHEITKKAIKEALRHPRGINNDLVAAQQARRVLDRLVGYKLSPFLWKKITRGLSAGRVQSVALRLVVERENEIRNFKPQTFWVLAADLQKKGCSDSGNACTHFQAVLFAIDEIAIEKPGITERKIVNEAIGRIDRDSFTIAKVEKKKRFQQPSPPFTTATLQQAAWSRLRFSSKKTMLIAQQLYEGIELKKGGATGLITYMRTDSLSVAEEALGALRHHIKEAYGADYVPEHPRIFTRKAKGAQEAHEAIRPVSVDLLPNDIKDNVTSDQFRLYSLIWKRFVASQMKEAEFEQTLFVIAAHAADKTHSYEFRTAGSILRFDGFLRITPTKKDDTFLPALEPRTALVLHELIDDERQTQPPPRFTEASLIKTLEKFGIGRPSTYAPTMSTIQDRHYVVKNDQKQFEPTEIGEKVSAILVKHFPQIVDIEFTAEMEQQLDEIAEGEKEWHAIIRNFYEPFAKDLQEKYETVVKEDMTEALDENCPECGKKLMIRHGRFGKFISCSGFPGCKFTKAIPAEPLNIKCPKCKEGDVVERRTRKRRVFYGCSRYPDCDFAVWQKPTGKMCPQCSSALVGLKNGIKCSNKDCRYKEEKKNYDMD
ncbi:MAG: type I DNA topoisomerase [Candidatus Niyogibacteria bacterium]|nr:type I DNA topoisomerase [Candidatus Niyogibacteria bacterium]